MSSLRMPAPDKGVIERRDSIAKALRAIVPGEGVIDVNADFGAGTFALTLTGTLQITS